MRERARRSAPRRGPRQLSLGGRRDPARKAIGRPASSPRTGWPQGAPGAARGHRLDGLAEDGEEEGVSQAEKEIHEGSEALLAAVADIHLYSGSLHPRSLAAYRRELAAGREYWNQGITELWYVAKKPGPPRI